MISLSQANDLSIPPEIIRKCQVLMFSRRPERNVSLKYIHKTENMNRLCKITGRVERNLLKTHNVSANSSATLLPHTPL